jgi:hypothetical protein
MLYFLLKCPVHILHQNLDSTATDLYQLLNKFIPIDSLCYPCMLNWMAIINFIKCVGKFHSQLLEFDFRFSPFSDLLCYIFPFGKSQVVMKIEKRITVTSLNVFACYKYFVLFRSHLKPRQNKWRFSYLPSFFIADLRLLPFNFFLQYRPDMKPTSNVSAD